jgi:hypothetical protein
VEQGQGDAPNLAARSGSTTGGFAHPSAETPQMTRLPAGGRAIPPQRDDHPSFQPGPARGVRHQATAAGCALASRGERTGDAGKAGDVQDDRRYGIPVGLPRLPQAAWQRQAGPQVQASPH